MTNSLHDTVHRVTQRIVERSRDSRNRYLDLMRREGDRHADRNTLIPACPEVGEPPRARRARTDEARDGDGLHLVLAEAEQGLEPRVLLPHRIRFLEANAREFYFLLERGVLAARGEVTGDAVEQALALRAASGADLARGDDRVARSAAQAVERTRPP